MADEACDKAATELQKGREARSNNMSEKQRATFGRRRAERAAAWMEQLSVQVFACVRAFGLPEYVHAGTGAEF